MTGRRLTWVQPEDLLGHELRRAAEDSRDASEFARRRRRAGGLPAPVRSGASAGPASPQLRSLAVELLDELDQLPSPRAADEPTELSAIRADVHGWTHPGDPGAAAVIEEAYRPTRQEVASAEEIIEAAAREAGAQALVDGRFVDAAIVAAARRTLTLARRR